MHAAFETGDGRVSYRAGGRGPVEIQVGQRTLFEWSRADYDCIHGLPANAPEWLATIAEGPEPIRAPDTLVPWNPMLCDPGQVERIAQNAVLAEGLQGNAAQVARRIADGLGDPLQSGPYFGKAPGRHGLTWHTQQGILSVAGSDAQGGNFEADATTGFVQARYERGRPVDHDTVHRMLIALGVEPATLSGSESPRPGPDIWQQTWAGYEVTWHAQMGRTLSNLGNENVPGRQHRVSMEAVFEFGREQPAIPDEEAMRIAEANVRCLLDDVGHTAAGGYAIEESALLGVAVHNGTIAYVIEVSHTTPEPDAHCGGGGAQGVFVDVVTGAVLPGQGLFGCYM